MTVCKIKLSPRWRLAACVAMLAVFTALCVVSAFGAMAENEKSASGASLKNEQAAADYMRAFGEADAAQLSCTPVTIPADFDAVYEEYNGLQLQNGHDLRNYKGKTAWQYIFSLAHHDASYAVLLVRDGAVIGGHLTNGEYGGDYLPLE